MLGTSTPKPPDTPRKRLSMSFKVTNKVLLDNVSDEDDDDNGNKDDTSVSVEQQQQKQKLTDEQLSELYKREIKLCTEKVLFTKTTHSHT